MFMPLAVIRLSFRLVQTLRVQDRERLFIIDLE